MECMRKVLEWSKGVWLEVTHIWRLARQVFSLVVDTQEVPSVWGTKGAVPGRRSHTSRASPLNISR